MKKILFFIQEVPIFLSEKMNTSLLKCQLCILNTCNILEKYFKEEEKAENKDIGAHGHGFSDSYSNWLCYKLLLQISPVCYQ